MHDPGGGAMSSCERDRTGNGLQEIRLQNRHMRVSVLPDAGGKISELVDRHSGRNWLWHNPHIPFGCAVYDADYGRDLDSGGWDEVLLSMKPAELRFAGGASCRIPDHGDVVGQKWMVIGVSTNPEGDAVCDMTVSGRALNYEFRRRLKLGCDSRRLEIHYSLTNNESFNCPWYWSVHALLVGQHDLQIELPEERRFRVDHTVNPGNGSADEEHAWPYFPLPGGEWLDLSRCFDADTAPQEFAGKIFVRSPDSGKIDVIATDSAARLTVRYDPRDLPWLGLWINNGGWSGCGSEPYLNLGLEPTTAAFDCVARAIDDESIAWLQPGQTRNWHLSVDLHS